MNAHINTLNSTGFLKPADYALIGATTYAQCDGLDGLKDGIITNPRKCKPDLSSLLCSGGVKASGCLIQEQLDNMKQQWAGWTAQKTGEFLFYGFSVGAEALPGYSVTGVPYGPGPGQLSVLPPAPNLADLSCRLLPVPGQERNNPRTARRYGLGAGGPSRRGGSYGPRKIQRFFARHPPLPQEGQATHLCGNSGHPHTGRYDHRVSPAPRARKSFG